MVKPEIEISENFSLWGKERSVIINIMHRIGNSHFR